MSIDLDLQRRDGAGWCVAHFGRESPIDDACRQVPEQVDDGGSGEPLEELPEARPNTGKRRHRRVERKQIFGTQALATSSPDRAPIACRKSCAGKARLAARPGG